MEVGDNTYQTSGMGHGESDHYPIQSLGGDMELSPRNSNK